MKYQSRVDLILRYQLAILLFASTGNASIQAQIPTKRGDLIQEFESIRDNMPNRDSEGFVPPTSEELAKWRSVIQAMLAENWSDAYTLIQTDFPEYELFQYTDTGNDDAVYYFVREKTPVTKGWGTFVFATSYLRQLAIETPHPIYDTNTYKQSPDMFRLTGARYLIMAGTHRCANSAISGCDGTSSSCGGAYKVSDMAHSVNTFFQITHEEIAKFNDKTYQVQIHGHSQSSCEDIFLSNGHNTVVMDQLLALRDHILTNTALTCEVAGQSSCTLVASTNVQGRFTNGVRSNPCNSYASAQNITGYFIHAEQTRTVRDNPGQYGKFAEALNKIIPLTSNQTAVQTKKNTEFPQGFMLNEAYPNPFNLKTNITIELPVSASINIMIVNSAGSTIRKLVSGTNLASGTHIFQWNGRNDMGQVLASGPYLIQMEAGTFHQTKKVIFAK
ncbi:MAG: T9SS type A sorting domain-containing protein [Deferribacteres bacterium]|nr:T9SS type A sorting domain-containing protein [candidate division KSB1 bacterium]MCB9504157.1 T9SS type A sorting domain-containing protein [Deferribacteres bacterium]